MEANTVTTTTQTAARAPGREHVVLYPKGFIAVRILQLIFTVIILGLAAFGVWWAGSYLDGPIFILVVAIFTLISSIYHLVCEYGAPSIYNYWAVLGLDIFMIIMWLSSFALLASQVAILFAYTTTSYDYVYDTYYSSSLSKGDRIVVSCLAAAASLGAAQFVLHLVSLIIHSINLHRHRAAGLHCTPVAPGGAPAPAAAYPVAAAMTMPVQTAENPAVYQNVAPQPTSSPAPQYMQAYPVQQTPSPVYPQPQVQPQFQPQFQPQAQPQAQPLPYYTQPVMQQGQVPVQLPNSEQASPQ